MPFLFVVLWTAKKNVMFFFELVLFLALRIFPLARITENYFPNGKYHEKRIYLHDKMICVRICISDNWDFVRLFLIWNVCAQVFGFTQSQFWFERKHWSAVIGKNQNLFKKNKSPDFFHRLYYNTMESKYSFFGQPQSLSWYF